MDEPPKRRLRKGLIAKATAKDLAELGVDPADNAIAAAAIRLATELDCAPSPKDAAAAARELRQAMAVVRGIAPPKELGDRIDQLSQRRNRRRAPKAAP
ncbi:hypothetical protein ACFY3G_17815 [Streptomyces phaeochromogenes]|uniref:hypothetical protein n=1 Tax=Streptomyces phaeochromogenes TaxID=1923 RepID=UPI0036C3656B